MDTPPKSQQACTRCNQTTDGKLDGIALCDACYSLSGACCAGDFDPDESGGPAAAAKANLSD